MKKISPPTNIPERPIFSAFEMEEPWRVPNYRRNLPHLRIQGATYFVTFRLADSIPEIIAKRWQRERHHWLESRGVDPKLVQSDLNRWYKDYFAIPYLERCDFEREQKRQFLVELDNCHGSCMLEFTHSIVAKAMDFFHGKRIWCGDYVVMPNHVHVLVQPFPGVLLEEWLYSIKRFTGSEICKNALLKTNIMMRQGHLWQTESFDRIVRNSKELIRIRQYIANNPAKLRSGTFSLKQMEWLDEFASK